MTDRSTVAILAQGTHRGDALSAALFQNRVGSIPAADPISRQVVCDALQTTYKK